ncbi:T9SS type A sorting domain-containing protein [candidate division KSB1 bacterium]
MNERISILQVLRPAGVLLFVAVMFVSSGLAQTAEPDSIAIVPEDTVVALEAEVQFTAEVFDSNSVVIDTTVEWSVFPESIGTIDSTGLFSAVAEGAGYVYASLGAMIDSASVGVVDTAAAGVINSITIRRMLPSGKLHNKVTEIQEGSGEYKFTGFPSPLNFLNGGRLQFPVGSLHEDIAIVIRLPQFVKIEGDTVSCFEHSDSTKRIASGAEFIVTVEGDTVSPYYFDIPVSVSLPYKKGLLAQLGLDPANLGMGFYTDTTGVDTSGISNTVLETSNNRIIADVAHFSALVLYGESEVSGVSDDRYITAPDDYILEQNYPNPFNPVTTLRFGLRTPANVTIGVYNILGQEVAVLIDRDMAAGWHQVQWNGTNSMGMPVSGGVYIYRMIAGANIQTRKMILIK